MSETYQTLVMRETDDGQWLATQDGIDLTGRGPNPGRAVAHFGELVAMTSYEDGGESRASD